MNPLTNTRNLTLMNEKELKLGTAGTSRSWHNDYKDSAWIFVGGLDVDLSEGDVICVFSQFGEVVNINLVRDKSTGKSKGYAFLCYEDQRSTILAVDNINGFKLAGRTIRVDHVRDYRVPNLDKINCVQRLLLEKGCAPGQESELHAAVGAAKAEEEEKHEAHKVLTPFSSSGEGIKSL